MKRRPVLSQGEIWQRYDAVESRLTEPVSERMLDLADLQPGMRVLDLASGRGEPALRAARRVGPEGRVLGVDLLDGLLEMARQKARSEGLSNLDLRPMNAELLDELPRAHFHASTVRWGLMYMASPVVALAHVRRALLPKGVLIAALWAEPERVPYYTLPMRLLERYTPLPVLDPEAPGTFRYADLDRIAGDFEQAGFTLDYVEEMDVPVFEAETSAEMLAWVRAVGQKQLSSGASEADQRSWAKDFEDEMERSRRGPLLRLGGVTRIVRARPI